MEHFSEQAWADFARGFGGSEAAQGIKAHIATGCMNCKTAHHFWERVQTTALAERAYTAPDGLVRMAKLEFGPLNGKRLKVELSERALSTAFAPLLAGVAAAPPSRARWSYEAEGLHRLICGLTDLAPARFLRSRPDTRRSRTA